MPLVRSSSALLTYFKLPGSVIMHASIRFNGENLSHSGKLKTMREIRQALSCVPALFPHVPHPDTLDQWLDSAVADYMTRRGKNGNKSNTGEGDDPETGAVPSRYIDPAIDAELALYVCTRRHGEEG